MRCLVPLLVLSLLPALAQAGTIHFSPSTVSVDNTKSSQDISLMYTPSPGARDLEVTVNIGLERLGWSTVEAVAPSAPGVKVLCSLIAGQVRALVFAPASGGLPATTFALCRLRVRPHAHSPSQTWYSITSVDAYEIDANLHATSLANSRAWAWVP